MLPGGIGLPLVSLNLQHTSLLSMWSASKHIRAPQTPVVENEIKQKQKINAWIKRTQQTEIKYWKHQVAGLAGSTRTRHKVKSKTWSIFSCCCIHQSDLFEIKRNDKYRQIMANPVKWIKWIKWNLRSYTAWEDQMTHLSTFQPWPQLLPSKQKVSEVWRLIGARVLAWAMHINLTVMSTPSFSEHRVASLDFTPAIFYIYIYIFNIHTSYIIIYYVIWIFLLDWFRKSLEPLYQ